MDYKIVKTTLKLICMNAESKNLLNARFAKMWFISLWRHVGSCLCEALYTINHGCACDL